MGRGREYYNSAKEFVSKANVHARNYFAKIKEEKAKREEGRTKRETAMNSPEMQKMLREYEEIADYIGQRHKRGLKEEGRIRRRRIAGLAGASVGAAAYGATLHKPIKKWTNVIYNDALAFKDLIQTARTLTPRSGQKQQIRSYFEAHHGLAEALGQTAKQYETNINTLSNTLRDIRVIADDLGRIARDAPGYDSTTVKILRELRNKTVAGTAQLATGRGQTDRLSEEYTSQFNALNSLLKDAVNKKGEANKNIAQIIKQIGQFESSGEQMLKKEQGELKKFMEQYNAYTSMVKDFGKLDTADIKSKSRQYRELIKTAEKNNLSLPQYHDIGTMISLSAGLLAAYAAARTSSRWLSWMIPPKRFDAKKEARGYLEEKVKEEQAKEERHKESNLESKTESWHGYDIILLAISLSVIVWCIGAKITGLAVQEGNEIVINSSLVISVIIVLGLLFAKIYKRKNINK